MTFLTKLFGNLLIKEFAERNKGLVWPRSSRKKPFNAQVRHQVISWWQWKDQLTTSQASEKTPGRNSFETVIWKALVKSLNLQRCQSKPVARPLFAGHWAVLSPLFKELSRFTEKINIKTNKQTHAHKSASAVGTCISLTTCTWKALWCWPHLLQQIERSAFAFSFLEQPGWSMEPRQRRHLLPIRAWQSLLILVGVCFPFLLLAAISNRLSVSRKKGILSIVGKEASLSCLPWCWSEGSCCVILVCLQLIFLLRTFPFVLNLPDWLTGFFPSVSQASTLWFTPCSLADCVNPGWHFTVFLALQWREMWVCVEECGENCSVFCSVAQELLLLSRAAGKLYKVRMTQDNVS